MLTHRKWQFIAILVFAFYKWFMIVATLIAVSNIYKELTEKYKTPIVFTKRIIRLYVTSSIITILFIVITGLYTGVSYIPTITALLLLFSNFVMLLANIINTPLEKYITKWYYNDAKKIINSHKELIIIGVTGSFGKTSTKNYLAGILSEKYNVLVTPGNFNTLLGVVRTIREELRPYHQIFIVEMGAKQRGDIQEICNLVHPQIGVLTAIGEMHLETFKSTENIQKTKFELIDSLPENGLAVLNYDSTNICQYNNIKSKCRIIGYGINNKEADYIADSIIYSPNGVSFALEYGNKKEFYESKLLGSGNLLNILASIAVANELQVPLNKQKSAISRLQPVEHRLSMRRANGVLIIDDAYNSNPAGAAMAIEVLKTFGIKQENKRIIITPGFVEMGTRQYEANNELGKIIATGCDYVIIVNETNREAIKNGIISAGFNEENIYPATNLTDAHTHLASILHAGDVVLYENDLPDNFK